MTGHSQRQWEGKFFRCQMACWYCRIPLLMSEATKDHLTPLARGGSDGISNIVPACIDCNQLKGVLTEEEFREQRKHLFTIPQEFPASPLLRETLQQGGNCQVLDGRLWKIRNEIKLARSGGNDDYADNLQLYLDGCDQESLFALLPKRTDQLWSLRLTRAKKQFAGELGGPDCPLHPGAGVTDLDTLTCAGCFAADEAEREPVPGYENGVPE